MSLFWLCDVCKVSRVYADGTDFLGRPRRPDGWAVVEAGEACKRCQKCMADFAKEMGEVNKKKGP